MWVSFDFLLVLFFVGVYCVSSFRFHYLMALLGLEIIIVSLYGMLNGTMSSGFGSGDLIVIFLVMMIVEGSFGLCILVSSSRASGGDYYLGSLYL